MKKTLIYLLHIGFWFCYLFLIIVILGATFQEEIDDEAVFTEAFGNVFYFALFPSILSFYSFYHIIFPHFLAKKKYLQAIIYGFLLAFLAALIGFSSLGLVDNPVCGDNEDNMTVAESITLALFFMTFITIISGILSLAIRGLITWFDELKAKEMLMEKNHQIELDLIKSQLDPHFLFNTLNNIDVLILRDPDMASEYLNKLSDIMRFMLYETKSDFILLSQEIEYIKKYVDLQKIRTNNQHYVDLKITGNIQNRKIVPMLFIPFIENAFKHTTNKKVENAIVIELEVLDSSIVFHCTNKYQIDNNELEDREGLGNKLIKKRLELVYPNKHSLNVKNHNHTYSINLTIHDQSI